MVAYTYGEDGINVIVDSENIGRYLYTKISTQDFTGATDSTALTQTATEYLKTVDKPTVNIEVNFILLSKTKEYEEFKFLENINLGDTLTVYNKNLNFSKKARVISYIFNSITNEYISIVLGDFLDNIADTFRKNNNIINNTALRATQLASDKQSITDNALLTKNKTIVGAINEIYNLQRISEN